MRKSSGSYVWYEPAWSDEEGIYVEVEALEEYWQVMRAIYQTIEGDAKIYLSCLKQGLCKPETPPPSVAVPDPSVMQELNMTERLAVYLAYLKALREQLEQLQNVTISPDVLKMATPWTLLNVLSILS